MGNLMIVLENTICMVTCSVNGNNGRRRQEIKRERSPGVGSGVDSEFYSAPMREGGKGRK